MKRLIDANKLLTRAKNVYTKEGYELLEKLVNSQETDYDIDRVIGKIEWLDFKEKRVTKETDINSEIFRTIRIDKYVRLDEVIDIIRKEGKR